MFRTKYVVVLYVINYAYLYHHIVVLDRYTHFNLVYYKHNGDDEPYGCLFVCTFFCMEELGSHQTNFHEIWYLSVFRKSVEEIQV